MNRRDFSRLLAVSPLVLAGGQSLAKSRISYGKGSVISPDVFVSDRELKQKSLRDIFAGADGRLNVLFIFGGGALGFDKALDGIWCRDSYEDLHILRTLTEKYREQAVNFIPIACPPVYHTGFMGFTERAFLDHADDSKVYQEHLKMFIKSTQQAVDRGIIPIQPWYDPRFRLLMDVQQMSLLPEYGDVPVWHGAFRAVDEEQTYGVPNFWLSNTEGEILTEPFRGNIYYPHGGDLTINYSLGDLVSAIDNVLADIGSG